MYIYDYLLKELNSKGKDFSSNVLKGYIDYNNYPELLNSDLWENKELFFPIEKYLKTNNQTYMVYHKDKNKYVIFDNKQSKYITITSNLTLNVMDIFTYTGVLEDNIEISDINLLSFKDNPECIINSYPSYSYDLYAIRNELVYYIYMLKPRNMEMCISLLKDYWHDFMITPASVSHHVYTGGMLVHIVENIRISLHLLSLSKNDREELLYEIFLSLSKLKVEFLKMSSNNTKAPFNDINLFLNDGLDIISEITSDTITNTVEELIITFIFHDIGKIYDFRHPLSNDFKYNNLNFNFSKVTTDVPFIEHDHQTNIYGHLMLSSLIYHEYSKKHSPEMYEHTILRNIAIHHGKREYGSIVNAQTPNEWLINISDKISSLLATSEYRIVF